MLFRSERGYAVADYLGNKNPMELVQELRSFASRRPGAFLLGALGAGLLTGRLVRGATASSHEQSTQYDARYALDTGATTYDAGPAYEAEYVPAYQPAYESSAVTRSTADDDEPTYVDVDPVVTSTTRTSTTTYGSELR